MCYIFVFRFGVICVLTSLFGLTLHNRLNNSFNKEYDVDNVHYIYKYIYIHIYKYINIITYYII